MDRWIRLTTIEKWKLDVRFNYVFERADSGGPYLAVPDDFGNLIPVEPNFDVIDA